MSAQEHLQPWCHRALGGTWQGADCLANSSGGEGAVPHCPPGSSSFLKASSPHWAALLTHRPSSSLRREQRGRTE